MKYDVLKQTVPKMQNSEMGQNVSNFCSRRPQKMCKNRWFRCFFLYLAHK